MAAAVAVAPVPFKDEDDDSSDDDFADELEAQLFEAEVKRDAVTGLKRERDEGRDEEPSAKRVVRDAGRWEEQHDGRGGRATLPLELTLQILRATNQRQLAEELRKATGTGKLPSLFPVGMDASYWWWMRGMLRH